MNFLNKFCNVLEFIFVNLFHTGSAIPNYIMTSSTNVEKGSENSPKNILIPSLVSQNFVQTPGATSSIFLTSDSTSIQGMYKI